MSTRKIDDLVRALGIEGISRSEVSRICKSLDEEVETFLTRPIEGEHPYVWLDATFHKVRQACRVTSVATVVAIGVNDQGQRTILGAATGQSEDHQFWTSFLRSLIKRGLKGVRLVISDAHEGLRQAIAKVITGATWQRCRVHFMRNLLSTLPKSVQDTVGAVVRSVFSAPDHATAMTQLHEVAKMLEPKFPRPRSCWKRPRKTPWLTCTSPASIVDVCTRRIRSSACTRSQAPHPGDRDLPDARLVAAHGRDAARRARR